ncbi:MAG: phosphotransferase [Candidatus Auribacterota bacterium]|nr:phosphotransferase [Candidatus Auribacterota bacterium]
MPMLSCDEHYFHPADENKLSIIIEEQFGITEAHVSLLTREGSDRTYYRIKNERVSLVMMVYGREKDENDYYVHIQQFLASIPINVPKILYSDAKKRWIFLEDLGETHLHTVVKSSQTDLFLLYRQVIDKISPLYTTGYENFYKKPFITAPPFDQSLYQWEHNYFIENFLQRYKHADTSYSDLSGELSKHAQILSGYSNKLVHRDLQSKNCMIYNNDIYFIDFQGLRPGLPEYDLASLLYDPYVFLHENMRNELADYFYTISRKGNSECRAEFLFRYNLCAAQRLMQALGAYGYLGLVKQKPQFIQYIEPAEQLLASVLRTNKILPSVLKLLG